MSPTTASATVCRSACASCSRRQEMRRLIKLGAAAAALIAMFASCDLEVNDDYNLPKPTIDANNCVYVWPVANNVTLTVTSAKSGSTEQISGSPAKKTVTGADYIFDNKAAIQGADAALKTTLLPGSSVEYAFTQSAIQGTGAWMAWGLMFETQDGRFGNSIRADTWIATTQPWGKRCIWSTGDCAGNFTYSGGWGFTSDHALVATDAVVVKVVMDDKGEVTITETVGGALKMTSHSTDWAGR